MRIGATLSGFEQQLLTQLRETNAASALNMLRLATGKKINSPSDNPTGFVQLMNWENQRNAVAAAQSNVSAASSMVSQAQLAIDQIRTQLNMIRTNAFADENQTLTAAQRAANQAIIDTAIAEINLLADTTVNGRRVLDGSANYTISGLNPSQILSLDVADLGATSSQTASGTVTAAGTQATLTYTGNGSNRTTAAATFTLTGDRGSSVISVSSNELLTAVVTRINLEAHLTGVTATSAGNILTLRSIDYGTNADMAVSVSSGTFTVTGGNGDGTANGTDGTATINGQSVTGDGNKFSLGSNGFSFNVEFAGGFSGAFSSVGVTGRALTFALSTDLSHRSTLSIPGVQATKLGGLSGTLNQLITGGTFGGLNTNAPTAVRIVDEALAKLTLVEARVDSFADQTIASSSALFSGMNTDLSTAIDSIDKVDEAEEAALLSKNQSLAANVLASLQILTEQRASILSLIQSLAR